MITQSSEYYFENMTEQLNIKPMFNLAEDGSCIPKDYEDPDTWLKISLIIILICMLVVSFLGNLLTLTALIYVRNNYRNEFTLLKGSSCLLLIQLSVLDILYCSIGFPHFIHSLLQDGENPFLGMDFGKEWCWTIAMLRNFFAEADFATIGAIAFMACRQKMCKECERSGNYSLHNEHDTLFQEEGVYTVMIITWLVSIGAILPDCLGITSVMQWSNGPYGCDVVYCGHKSYGMMANILTNVVIIIVSYCRVIKKVNTERKEAVIRKCPGPDVNNEEYTRHIKLLVTMAISYNVCVLPASFVCWGQFDIDYWFGFENPKQKLILKACLNILYWLMYCINFILYLVTYNRIRDAFRRFLNDVRAKFKRRNSTKSGKSIGFHDVKNLKQQHEKIEDSC